MHFELWLEFEEWVGEWDPDSDFCNVAVTLGSGATIGLNVWTYRSIPQIRADCQKDGDSLGGRYLRPPDLLVERLDRSLLEEVIRDLIENGEFAQVAAVAAIT